MRPVESPGLWFSPDAYPPEAIRAKEQGRVVARLEIDPQGNVANCIVTISSGSAALDAKTCELAMTRGKFIPGLDARGKPIASTYTLPIRWVLPVSSPVALGVPWRAAAVIAVDPSGKSISCKDERWGAVPADVQLCLEAEAMPSDDGRFARGYSASTKPIEIVTEIAMRFDGGAVPPTIYDAGGRETVVMSEIHFEVDVDGSVKNCQVVTQSGPAEPSPCANPPGPFAPTVKAQGVTFTVATSRRASK